MIRRHAGLITIAICIGYLIVGLWPFNFFPHNNVEWLPDSPGIKFSWLSAIYGSAPLDLSSSGEITIELWLEPEEEPSDRIGAILSLYDGSLPENLLIGQWESGVLLRTPIRNAQGEHKYREVGADDALPKGSRRFIFLTSSRLGTAFYVDGNPIAVFPKLTLRPETLRGRLVLGDSPQGGGQWRGKLFGVAVFSRALEPWEVFHHYDLWISNHAQDLRTEPQVTALYLFDKANGKTVRDYSPSNVPLEVSEIYHRLRRSLLLPPWKDGLNISDIVVNILGFVPFGFFFFLYCVQARALRTLRNAILTIVVATIISITIEIIQAYLPTRDSSLTDVLCNSGGALLGLLVASTYNSR